MERIETTALPADIGPLRIATHIRPINIVMGLLVVSCFVLVASAPLIWTEGMELPAAACVLLLLLSPWARKNFFAAINWNTTIEVYATGIVRRGWFRRRFRPWSDVETISEVRSPHHQRVGLIGVDEMRLEIGFLPGKGPDLRISSMYVDDDRVRLIIWGLFESQPGVRHELNSPTLLPGSPQKQVLGRDRSTEPAI